MAQKTRQISQRKNRRGQFAYMYAQTSPYREDLWEEYEERRMPDGYQCEICGERAIETLPDSKGATYLECSACGFIAKVRIW